MFAMAWTCQFCSVCSGEKKTKKKKNESLFREREKAAGGVQAINENSSEFFVGMLYLFCHYYQYYCYYSYGYCYHTVALIHSSQ